MRRLLTTILLLAFAAFAVHPASAASSPLGGTLLTVNNSPGDQLDSHVSGDWVSYTDFSVTPSRIRYHNLVTGLDAAVPDPDGGQDVVSAISGMTILYMHITNSAQAIYKYEIGSGAAPAEIDPQPGEIRMDPAIGGRTVAWADSTSNASGSDIMVYNLDTGTAARLTSNGDDVNPAVSPDGHVVVWTSCNASFVCHIWQATLSSGSWTTQQLTDGTGVEESPHTDGHLVVYDSLRGDLYSVYSQPVGGGAESAISSGQGDAREPHVSSGLISYQQQTASPSGSSWAVYVYSVATGQTYAVPATPGVDEVLSDVSVGSDGLARVTWTASEQPTGFNVYTFRFRVPTATLLLTVQVSGLGGNRATISNGDDVLGTASGEMPLVVSLPESSDLALRASPIVIGPDDTMYFFDGFNPKPPSALTQDFTTVAAYVTMSDVITGALAGGGIYGPGAQGIANSLTEQWNAVQVAILAGDSTGALAALQDFTSHVLAQADKHLTPALRDQLLADAALASAAIQGAPLPTS